MQGTEQARAACLRERSSRALCGENMVTVSGAVAVGAGDAACTPPPPAVGALEAVAAGGAAAAALRRSCSTANSARVEAASLSASRIESRHASSWVRRLLWNSAAGPCSAPPMRVSPRAPGPPRRLRIGVTSWERRRRPGLARRKLLDSGRAPSCTPATARGTRSHSEVAESDGSEADSARLVTVGRDSTAALTLPAAEAVPSPPTSSGGGRGNASRVAPAVAGRGASYAVGATDKGAMRRVRSASAGALRQSASVSAGGGGASSRSAPTLDEGVPACSRARHSSAAHRF